MEGSPFLIRSLGWTDNNKVSVYRRFVFGTTMNVRKVRVPAKVQLAHFTSHPAAPRSHLVPVPARVQVPKKKFI